MSPDRLTHSEPYHAEEQRANQSSPAIFPQSRASSQAAYYHNYHYHREEHDLVPERDEDGTSAIESTYSFVSPSEAASSRTDGSEADGSAGSGKKSRFPKFKLSLTASPPKPKPKPKPKKPPTPRSAVCIYPRFPPDAFILGGYHLDLTSSLCFRRYLLAVGALEMLSVFRLINPLQHPLPRKAIGVSVRGPPAYLHPHLRCPRFADDRFSPRFSRCQTPILPLTTGSAHIPVVRGQPSTLLSAILLIQVPIPRPAPGLLGGLSSRLAIKGRREGHH